MSKCVFCGGPAAGVYFGHNTGTPFPICERRVLDTIRYGIFTVRMGKEVFPHKHDYWRK